MAARIQNAECSGGPRERDEHQLRILLGAAAGLASADADEHAEERSLVARPVVDALLVPEGRAAASHERQQAEFIFAARAAVFLL